MNDPTTTPEMKLTILQDGAYAYSGMGLDEFEITEMTAGNSKTLSSDIREHCEYLEMKLKENFRKDTKAETNAQIARLAKLGYDVTGICNWVNGERYALAEAAEERRLAEEAANNPNNFSSSLTMLNREGRAESNKQARSREIDKGIYYPNASGYSTSVGDENASGGLWDKMKSGLDSIGNYLYENRMMPMPYNGGGGSVASPLRPTASNGGDAGDVEVEDSQSNQTYFDRIFGGDVSKLTDPATNSQWWTRDANGNKLPPAVSNIFSNIFQNIKDNPDSFQYEEDSTLPKWQRDQQRERFNLVKNYILSGKSPENLGNEAAAATCGVQSYYYLLVAEGLYNDSLSNFYKQGLKEGTIGGATWNKNKNMLNYVGGSRLWEKQYGLNRVVNEVTNNKVYQNPSADQIQALNNSNRNYAVIWWNNKGEKSSMYGKPKGYHFSLINKNNGVWKYYDHNNKKYRNEKVEWNKVYGLYYRK